MKLLIKYLRPMFKYMVVGLSIKMAATLIELVIP